MVQVGEQQIRAGTFGSDQIRDRINDINGQWDGLKDIGACRKKRLLEAVDFYQVRLEYLIVKLLVVW